ncbi:MAG: OmpH family outer membrane protein [Steroidobacteraceae bacterium]
MSVVTVRKVVAAVMVLAMFAAGSAYAEMKIAIVDFQRLVEESPQAKAAGQVLQTEFASRQRELQQKEKDLQTKAEKLSRDAAIMSEQEMASLKKELTKGQSDLQRDGEAFNEEVNSRRNEELGKLQALLVTEVAAFAKTGAYDLMIPSSVALYSKDTYNVTAQVLTYLQSRPLVAAPVAASKPAAK